MTATAEAPPGGAPAGGKLPDGGGKRDLWITYWIFAVFYLVLSVCICLLGRATPPPRPDVSDLQAVNWFAQHHLGIQIGFVILLMIAGCAAIANGIIGYFMMRMTSGKPFAYAYIATMGVGAVPGFQLLLCTWLTATFRPDRDPQVLHMLYDLGMLSYNGSLGCFTAAYIVVALAVLYDKNHIFPRWFAYVTVWQVVTEVLASQLWLHHSGAVAWNGVMTIYIALFIFGLWIVFFLYILWKCIKLEPAGDPGIYGTEVTS